MKSFRKLKQLKEALLGGGFAVAEDIQSHNNVTKRMLLFPTYDDFIKHQDTVDGKHFYEFIYGIQRIYMDIDVPNGDKGTYDDEVDTLISHIHSIYPNTKVNVYTSHRVGKLSYHLIVQNLYVYDNVQCKARVQAILDTYQGQIKQYIDTRVYRDMQQLRLLGSSKMGVDNTKVPYIGSTEFMDSLVSYYDGSPVLPYVDTEYKVVPMAKYAREYHMMNGIRQRKV